VPIKCLDKKGRSGIIKAEDSTFTAQEVIQLRKSSFIVAIALLSVFNLALAVDAPPGKGKGSHICDIVTKKCATTKADDSETVAHAGKCAGVTLNIEGMEGTECETKIGGALIADSGVICLKSISHKDGKAVVCYDPDRAKPEKLTAIVVGLGYEAEAVVSDGNKQTDCITDRHQCLLKCQRRKSPD
jgi:hypothetical protein